MTSEQRQAEMLAQIAITAKQQEEQQRQYRAYLRGKYGPGDWPRGTILIFYPGPDEKDQEIRAAIKIGVNEWALTARGGTRTWDETLVKIGPSKLMHLVTATQPEIVIEADHAE